MPPTIPAATTPLVVFVISLLLGSIVFWFMYRASHAQFSKPTDCVPEKAWGSWGECTSDCQGGQQFRTRTIATLPANGGKECNISDLIQSRTCNEEIQCGQNCKPGNPALYSWNPCPPCAASGVQPVQYKFVPPQQIATTGGQDCNIDDVFLYKECETFIPPCPPDLDCVLAPYYESPCNVPCGSGTKFVYSSISRFPSGKGKDCDMGLLVTQEACSLGPCNCDSLTWSGTFSECNAACGPGVQIMMRNPQPSNPADGLCPFFSITECELTPCPNATCTAPSIDLVQALCYLICAGHSLSEIDIDPSICLSDDIFNAVCGFNASSLPMLLASMPEADMSDPVLHAAFVSSWFGFDNCQPPKDCSLSSFSTWSGCSNYACLLEFPFGGTRTRVRTIEDAGNSGGIACTDQIFIDYEPCNNYVEVSYTAWDETLGNFVASVSAPQCQSQTCVLSSFYSVTGFQGGCGPTCTQVWNRSISDPGSNPGSCPTDPIFFVSTSTCCGVNPDASQTNCGVLPDCVNCVWETWTSLSLRCPSGIVGTRTVTVDAVLVSESNIPGQNCFAIGQQCSWPFVTSTNPTWSEYSCSSFARVCSSTNECPSGCDSLVCSGHGTYSISTVSGIVTCSCVCDVGFAGSFCQNVLPRCPIASVSGLECNGLGSCDGPPTYSCTCNNAFDTTVDCTGSSSSWCWLYGVVSGTLSTNTFTLNSIRKLLGAIPIASTSAYTFTEQDCLSITQFGTLGTLSGFLTNVVPEPVLLGMNTFSGAGVQSFSSGNVGRAFFQGVVESAPPATLVTQLPHPQFCSDFSFPTSTEGMLSSVFGSALASKFIPRFLPGSSPLQCETLFTNSIFSEFGQQSLSVLSLSNLPPQGPGVPPLEGVGAVYSCVPAFGIGTFTQFSPLGATGNLFSSVFMPLPSLSTPLSLTDANGTTTVYAYDALLNSTNTWGFLSPPATNRIVIRFADTPTCGAMVSATSGIPARFTIPSPPL